VLPQRRKPREVSGTSMRKTCFESRTGYSAVNWVLAALKIED